MIQPKKTIKPSVLLKNQKRSKVTVEMIAFDGPHDIPKEVLLEMTDKLGLI